MLKKILRQNTNFDALVERERAQSYQFGGKTVFGDAKPQKEKPPISNQLKLF
ncbi:hypothetical protein [uncultured Flavobacterium sp.]|uniref:hypothetical protein n=1 Tax=uncultured Flavobacterium sp. TaxID=165435 RepID=UPI0025F7D455|nr:hypothetical protein [uncultured Flavobacterium sp.]